MMNDKNQIEATGRTVEEAVEEGLNDIGIDREYADIEILEEPSKGLFGFFGGKEARVRITVNLDPRQLAEEFFRNVFDKMAAEVELNNEEKGEYLYINLSGSSLGSLIGRRGETLDSLQYLGNLAVNKKLSKVGRRARIILDAEGYREKREQTLIRLAKNSGEKAVEKGSKIVLEPMSPHERRIIHMALQGNNKLETYSEGTEPYRKVVINPKSDS